MKDFFKQMGRNMFWFLPTKEDEKNFKDKRIENYKREIPKIKSRIINFEEQSRRCEQKIMQSEQAENLLKLKVIHQKLLFEHNRLNHHISELYEIS